MEMDEKQSDDQMGEQPYDMTTMTAFTPCTTSASTMIPSLMYPEYEWHRAPVSSTQTIFMADKPDVTHFQSYLGYSPMPPTEIPTASFWQGEVGLHPGIPNYAYPSAEHLHKVVSTVGSGLNGKPKRKRVQTYQQRKAANIRERRRMFHLNEAFDELRKRLPAFNYEKRLSRIETLRLAITYISFMKEITDGKDPKDIKLKAYKKLEDEIFAEMQDDLDDDDSIDQDL